MTNLPNASILAEYFEGKRTTPVYEHAKKLFEELKLHANGSRDDASDLIRARRPNEGEEVHGYRMSIYEPITFPTVNKVISSLGKIRRSRDWAIKYPKESYSKIPDTETLYEYCEKSFPYYSSVTNWTFSVGLKSILVDANCAILVVPVGVVKPNEYKKPYPIIFHADQVIEYIEGNFAILKASDQVQVQTQNGVKMSDKFYIITDTDITPYVKKGDNWVSIDEEIIVHNLGYLPIIRPRCQFVKTISEYNLFCSRIHAMVPNLNEAVREYSDLQASIVSHMFPERWEVATQECRDCGGKGTVPNPTYTGTDVKSKQLVCATCNGLGATSGAGPYKKTVIRLPKTNLGEQPTPMPPFDYVKKDIEVIKVMDERLKMHTYNALSAINMQFLEQVPLNISGDAKAIDRDELNNFVYNIAEDVVYVLDILYGMIADYRYGYQYPLLSDRRRMLPDIAVPEQYELLGGSAYLDDIVKMKTNGLGGSAMTAMLQKMNQLMFWNEPEISNALTLELQLDRYSGMAEADILAAFQAGEITQVDYRIHLNIKDYVKRAIDGDFQNFINLDYDVQYQCLVQYAQEEINNQKLSLVPPAPATRPDPVITTDADKEPIDD